jgi:hypothetical protein
MFYNIYNQRIALQGFITRVEANNPENALDVWIKASDSPFKNWETHAFAAGLTYEVFGGNIVIDRKRSDKQ